MTRPHISGRLVAGVAALVLAASTVATPPANAETLRVDDRGGDVWEGVYDDDGRLVEWIKAGSPSNTDILETVVRHGERRLTVVTQLADLDKRDTWFRDRYDLRVAGLDETVHVDLSAYRRWKGELTVYTIEGYVSTDIGCARAGHRIDYARDRIRFWLPRGCLGAPDWVRVRSSTDAETMDTNRHYRDVFDSGRHAPPSYGARVRWGTD